MKKLDPQVARRIIDFMEDRIATLEDPRSTGAALIGVPEKIWRYRVGDYRILCDIQDNKLVVLVVEIGHRSSVYRR
jgi:mRNA interferase RelE/StbE